MKNPEQKAPRSSASYPSSTFEDFLDRSGLGDIGLTPEEIRREIATDPVTKAIVEAFAEVEAKTIEQGSDPLTGCLNLNGLEEFLDRRDKQFSQHDYQRTKDVLPQATLVVMVDGDGIKEINDTYGHAEGDRTIVALADKLRDSVRADDVVVRLGGDEFLVIADIYSDNPDAAQIIVKKIEESTSNIEISSDSGGPINVGASVGFEYLQGFQGKSAIEAARKRADKTMYDKKEAKKLASADN